jgi:hypothetical protein
VRGISGAPTIACSAGDTGFVRVMPVALFFFRAAAGAAGGLDEAAVARATTDEAERRGGAKEAVGGAEPCRGTGSEKENDATVSMGTAAIWARFCGWSLGLGTDNGEGFWAPGMELALSTVGLFEIGRDTITYNLFS